MLILHLEALGVGWGETDSERISPRQNGFGSVVIEPNSSTELLNINRVVFLQSEMAHNLEVLLPHSFCLIRRWQLCSEGLLYSIMRQLWPFLDQEAMLIVTHALVTSCLDDCNPYYMMLPLESIQKLHLVQNMAAWTGRIHCFGSCVVSVASG